MCHASQGPQIQFPIEMSVDVFEHAVHPRRVFGKVGSPGQSVRLREIGARSSRKMKDSCYRRRSALSGAAAEPRYFASQSTL